MFLAKKFDTCKSLSKKFDICCKIVDRDVGNFVRHPDKSVLRYPFMVSNFSVNFIYSGDKNGEERVRKGKDMER